MYPPAYTYTAQLSISTFNFMILLRSLSLYTPDLFLLVTDNCMKLMNQYDGGHDLLGWK